MDNDSEERTLLLALVALLLDERAVRTAGQADAEKPEVILARVGLPISTIATVLGKQPDAVKKAIQRSRAKA
jgi:DNA-directed RNA polymerase specialized sigma24 family protein